VSLSAERVPQDSNKQLKDSMRHTRQTSFAEPYPFHALHALYKGLVFVYCTKKMKRDDMAKHV